MRKSKLFFGLVKVPCLLRSLVSNMWHVAGVEHLPHNQSVVSFNPNKDSCCSLEHETLPSVLLSTGLFQEQIRK